MIVEQLYTKCLAEAAYYIESNGEAAIIDPLRETQPYLDIARNNGAKIKYIFETHFHADFVSGHIDLAKQTGAQIVYGPNANPAYDVIEAKDNQEFKIGAVTIRVMHTPGHLLNRVHTFYWMKTEKKMPSSLGIRCSLGMLDDQILLSSRISHRRTWQECFLIRCATELCHCQMKPLCIQDTVLDLPAVRV